MKIFLKTRLSSALAVLALFLFLPVMGVAQTINGSISGAVTDQNGSAISGATIKVTKIGTGATRDVATNSEGIYRIVGLPVGLYSVRVEQGGFQPQVNERVEVNVAVDARANFTLTAASVQEVVIVTETAGLLETTQSQMVKTVGERTILELPGRNNLNGLALLNPGVLPTNNARPGSGFAVNGNRTRSNNFTIDGANNNDESLSTPRQNLPPEAIGEFQLITNNFAAEFGRNAGSYVNVITRSGNNEYHGIAHYTWQGNGLDSLTTNQQRTYNTQRGLGIADKPALRAARSVIVDNLYGGTIGGPVKKDHTFFFTSLDFEDVRQTVSNVQRNAISQAGVNALRSISSQFAPGALDFLLKTFPVANVPNDRGKITLPFKDPADPTGATNIVVPINDFNRTLNGGIPYGTDFWRYLAKVDTKINSKDQLSFRYIIDQFNDPGSPAALAGQEIGQISRNQSFTINDVYAITSNLINESRITYSRRNINFPENLPTTFTISGTPAFSFPANNINYPQFRIDNAYELTDNLSYIEGRHNWKFGVNALRYDLNSFFAPNLRGTISYASLTDFLLDQNATVSQFAGNGLVPAHTYETGVFAQDDWRVNQDLTLNLGLRYEYVTTPFGFFSNAKSDMNNFGPAVGGAWNPKGFRNGRFVLRGGYRISYDQVFQNVLLNVARNFPRAVNVSNNMLTGTQPYIALPPTPQPQDFKGDPNMLPLRLYSPNKRIDQPMSQQFTLGVQYQLANDYVVKIDYVGTRGSNLIREVEANVGFSAPIGNGLRQDPTKGSILVGDGIANSIYHAGQVTLEKRFGETPYGAFQFNVNYTYSSFINDSDDILGGQANRTLPADPRNPRLDRARSGFDQPNRFVASYTYGIPKFEVGSGLLKSFTDRAINGWELAGVTTFADGTPYSILNASNALGILTGQIAPITDSQRVTLNQNGVFPSFSAFDTTKGQFTNPNARFLAFPINSGVVGTLGANTQRTGGTNNTNMALVKNVKTYGESQSIQIRWEVTNVFNHRNFTVIPLNTVSSSTTAAQFLNLGQQNVTGRSMLFTARYSF
jgi:outer membrane receptor protein involved in Fe transport